MNICIYMPYKIITKFVALSESFKFPLLCTALSETPRCARR
ncbi:unnamed protein product [Brassica napus]|uniref:(rape) hypothetical protein n=1 Tax=Brassica napus TaxID=3708 RepID=A0A816MYM8_BRANA|nr:unnamed protein product [Brassica napus]